MSCSANPFPSSPQGAPLDLYLVMSPWQWWLVHGLSHQLQRPFVMVISDGFKGARALYEINLRVDNPLLIESLLIPDKLSNRSDNYLVDFWNKRTYWFTARKLLSGLLKRRSFSRVYTANFILLPTQFLYSRLLKNNVPFHVIDDGLNSYREIKVNKKSFVSLFYKSLTHWFWIPYPRGGEVLVFFSEGWFINPNAVASRFKSLIKHQIDSEVFSRKPLTDLSREVIGKFGVNLGEWQKPKVVMLFSRSDYLQQQCPGFSISDFSDSIAEFLSDQNLLNENVWVKYHPREKTEDVFALKNKIPRMHLIPQTIPFEILSNGLSSGDWVIGEISTALFDVAINYPKVKVVSLSCIEKGSDMERLFNGAGVMLKRDLCTSTL